MTIQNVFQITLEMWGSCFLMVCAIIIYLGPESSRRRNRYLLWMLMVCIILLMSDTIAYIFRGNPTQVGYWMVRISNYFVFMTPPIIGTIMAMYIADILAQKKEGFCPKTWIRVIVGIGVADLLMITVSQFTGFLYYFDSSNLYHRNTYFWVCAAVALVIMVILMIMILHYRNWLAKNQLIALLIYILLPFLSNIIQVFYYGLSMNNVALTLSLIIIYIVHVLEATKEFEQQKQQLLIEQLEIAEQEQELAQKNEELMDQRVQSAFSQMRPHFIFNCLATIELLCEEDSEKAEEATHQFAKYLRRTINAITREEMIPFMTELEHIRSYIWLEEMRFEDDFIYDEDIQISNFCIPSLTVQPLVENAVKHGMMKKEEGITNIFLSTTETESEYVIIVEDDGAGFDASQPFPEEKGRNGISTVRKKVEMCLGGTVAVESEIGKGTKIEIRVPKKRARVR